MNEYTIKLNNLKFSATHGLNESEKEIEQLFEVDISISSNKDTCHDDINLSIDYECVYNLIVKIFKENCFNLLETLGEKIIDSIFNLYSVKNVVVTIRKPEVTFDNNSNCVEVTISKNK